MIEAVISGGQTGADRGGLLAAKDLGLGMGGFAPRGWRTEEGPAPWLEDEFNMVESPSEDYKVRTRQNVQLGHATVIFGRRSPGSNATEEFCRVLKKPCLWISWSHGDVVRPALMWKFLNNTKYMTILNVAGNRESKNPGIQEWVREYLRWTLR